MATEAGVAYVTVKYDPSSISRLRRDTATHGRSIGSTLGSAGARAGRYLAVGIGAGAAAAGYGLVKAVQSAATFEKQLNVLQAVSGATAGQMQRIQDESIALGKDLSLPATSAQDAALAMTELAKGGVSVRDAMKAARGTLELAAAGQIEVGDAAKVTANALNAFGLAGSQAGHVADLLAGAANASSGEVSDFAIGLQQASASAHQLNVPIQDTITALAELANAGIQGSDAGTSLRTMFIRLAAPTEKAQKEISRLHLSAFDAKGEFIGLADTADKYQRVLSEMTPKQQAQVLQTIFGTDAQRAANIILGHGSAAFDKLAGKVDKTGNAQKLARAQTKGFSGVVQGFTSNLETLGIQLGLVLLPVATKVVGALTDIVGAIGKVASAKSPSVAIHIVWRGVQKLYDSLDALLFGEVTTASKKAGSHRDTGFVVPVNREGFVSQITDAFRSVPWKSIGVTIGSNIGNAISFTSDTAGRIVKSLVVGINANKQAIGEAGVGIILALLAAMTDPGVWLDNWQSIVAVAITIGTGPWGKAGSTVARFFGRGLLSGLGRFAARLPGVFQDAILAVGLFFRYTIARAARSILATLRGTATRFPTIFNRAWNIIERAAVSAFGHAFAAIRGLAIRTFNLFRREGEEAVNSVGRAIVRAVAKVGQFLVKFTLVKAAVDGIVSAFQYVIDKIREAISWVENLAGKIASIDIPSPGGFLSGLNPFRASGGPVVAGQPYVVGERRAELFVPSTNGTILPSITSPGDLGGPIQVNVLISRRAIAGIAEVEVVRGKQRTTRAVQAGSKW